jgi:predicted acylesterase/phospholipase RssA
MTSEHLLRRLLEAGIVFLLSGCATPYVLERTNTSAQMFEPTENETLVGLAVSGGGSRAATFTAAVLEELAKRDVGGGKRPTSLLEKINYISSVSGGSLCNGLLRAGEAGKKRPQRARHCQGRGANTSI